MSDILHYYLDLLSGENEDRFGFHNVLNVMKQSRSSYVLNESFDGIDLRNEPLVGIHFSDEDGKNASSFCGCKVNRSCFLSGHSAPIESMEFIDDNTLVSRSTNEVITWDIQMGMPIKAEQYKYENNIVNNDYNIINEFIVDEKKLQESLDAIIETSKYRIHTYSSDYRLVSFSSSFDDYIIDLQTKRIISCSVIPYYIIKIEQYYIFYNNSNKELYIYDADKIDSKPYGSNLFFKSDISLEKIENTPYLFVKDKIEYTHNLTDLEKHLESVDKKSYIIDIQNCKIVREFNEQIITPTYIPELNYMLIRRETNAIELYNSSDVSFIVRFENVDTNYQSISISNDKKYIAFSNSDFGVDIYFLKTGVHKKSCGGNTAIFYGVESYDRTKMICFPISSFNHTCMLWDIVDNQIIKKINIKYTNIVSFSPDSTSVLIHNQLDNTISSYNTKSGNCIFTVHPSYDNKTDTVSKYFPDYFEFSNMWWDYSGNYCFFSMNHNHNIYIYDKGGILHGIFSIQRPPFDISISDNKSYLAYLDYDGITVLHLETSQTYTIEQSCICLLNVSNDGKYVEIISDVDFKKAIVKVKLLDMIEKKCIEKLIKEDDATLNYVKQFFHGHHKKHSSHVFTVNCNSTVSSGWTMTVPSSPDNSTEALIYLAPNLYIGGCDFRGSTFDDETKEIIRQYNGLV